MGEASTILGYTGKDKVVMQFEKYDDEFECALRTTVAINTTNLSRDEPEDDEEVVTGKKGKLGAKFKYVDEGTVLVKDWHKRQTGGSTEIQASRLKTKLAFVMDRVIEHCPVYTPDDLTIGKVGDVVSVYAHKTFEVGTLVFAPDTHEVKSRKWTHKRSVIVKNSASLHPVTDTSLVLDGRNRSEPTEGHIVNLFFAITRTSKEDTNLCRETLGKKIQADKKNG